MELAGFLVSIAVHRRLETRKKQHRSKTTILTIPKLTTKN
jgi:hypothetical protein